MTDKQRVMLERLTKRSFAGVSLTIRQASEEIDRLLAAQGKKSRPYTRPAAPVSIVPPVVPQEPSGADDRLARAARLVVEAYEAGRPVDEEVRFLTTTLEDLYPAWAAPRIAHRRQAIIERTRQTEIAELEALLAEQKELLDG